MEQFLESLSEEYGSYDDLAAALGVVEAMDRLRDAVLVDA